MNPFERLLGHFGIKFGYRREDQLK